MTNRNPEAPTVDRGVIFTDSGIAMPASANRRSGTDRLLPNRKGLSKIINSRIDENNNRFRRGYCYGYTLDRDDCDLVIRWPCKGSGVDDVLSAALVDGQIANAGISPVVQPQIASLLKRQESQARTAEVALTGRKTPVSAAQNALARANDSPLGITQFISQLTYQLRVFNRGAPMATVPITYDSSLWETEGLTAVPLGENKNVYYLEVDWSVRKTAIPYLPPVWDLWPSDNPTWPYWFRTKIDDTDSWVLLHCSQIISILPGSALYGAGFGGAKVPIVGTSTVYMLWGILAEHVLKVDARTDRLINRVTDGFLALSGIEQTPSEVKEEIESEKAVDDVNLSMNYTVLTSPERVFIDSFTFRDDPVEWEQWREYAEDIIALAFEEPLQALVQRGGLSVHQSETAAEDAADAGVNSVLDLVGKALGAIYPRVQVAVTRQNDAAQRLNVGMFREFADAVRGLPEDTLTRDEIRALIERDIFEIPATGDDTVTDSATDDTDDPVDNGELSDRLEILYYQAMLFESIQDAIDSTPYTQLLPLITNGIQGSYDSVDMTALMDSIQEDETVDEVAQRIGDDGLMDPASDHTDLDELLTLILALAVMGINQGDADADAEGVDGLTQEQRDVVLNDSSAFLGDRVDELYVAASGDSTGDIDDPRLDQTLDDTSRKEVAGAAIRNDTPDVAIAALADSAASRGALIREVEGLRAHGYGHNRTGRELGAQFKQWLRTTSANPREEHLATVGEIVPFDSAFSNGDTWSGERVRCQCGIRILWG